MLPDKEETPAVPQSEASHYPDSAEGLRKRAEDLKKAEEGDDRPSVIAGKIRSNITTMSRVPDQNKIIAEIMEIQLDNKTQIRFTLKYDPFSLIQERNRIIIDKISQGVLENIGHIEWDFELESFFARLLAIWSKNYQIAQVLPVIPTPDAVTEHNADDISGKPPFEQR